MNVALLLTGTAMAWWAYTGLSRADDAPVVPALAYLHVLQPVEASGETSIEIHDARFDLFGLAKQSGDEPPTFNVFVCSDGDAALFFSGLATPDEALLSDSLVALSAGTFMGDKGVALVLHQDDVDIWSDSPPGPPCAQVTVRTNGWISDQSGASTALRIPTVASCAGGQTVDLREDGVWATPTTGNCTRNSTTVKLGQSGVISSASSEAFNPYRPEERPYAGWSAYEGDSVVLIEDTAAISGENRGRTANGVVLGVGLTLAVEGMLGLLGMFRGKRGQTETSMSTAQVMRQRRLFRHPSRTTRLTRTLGDKK